MALLDLFFTPPPAAAAAKPAATKPPTPTPLAAVAPLLNGMQSALPSSAAPAAPGEVPTRFREAVDAAFAQAAAPHLSVYLSLESGFREMVNDATTRAALALKGAVTQGHTKDGILVDVHEAAEALAAVKGEAEKARDGALARDAVALETEMQAARTRAQQLRDEAAALDAKVATLSVEAATARAEIEATFRNVCTYIDAKHQELFTIERTLGGKP